MEEGLETLQEKIAYANFTNVQQSTFLMGLEEGLKGIIMAILSSMYGCSAIPVLPNKVMDYPCPESFKNNVNVSLWKNYIYPGNFDIPVRMIDPMGMLEITPTTKDGRAYYEIEGHDTLYRKTKRGQASQIFSFGRKNILDNAIFITEELDEKTTKLFFNTVNELPENITISIGYLNPSLSNLLIWNTDIKISDKKSEKGFIIMDGDEETLSCIKWIKINNKEVSCEIPGNICCYLSKTLSNDILNKYNIFDSVKWKQEDDTILLSEEGLESEYYYQKIDIDTNEGKKDFKKAKRMNHCPTFVSENDPELIKVYEGLDPNLLYQSFDMNAFIWYTMVKSSRSSQVNINHTMWDSRLPALKNGVERNNGSDSSSWTYWYNSKSGASCEFKYGNKVITKKSSLYPILQLKKSPYNLYAINVSFPSQRYFKTKYRDNVLENNNPKIGPTLTFNSSIYRFNKEYLDSIQILRPKLMLTGFLNYLLGFSIDAINNMNFDFTKKVIQGKLSSAITKIIEADDMEIEDCYTSFSNDEYDNMLEEMMLSRYSATYYGGENNKVKTHDVDYYLSLIDSYNTSKTKEESISKITRLVDEVTATPGTESTIDYGINFSYDANILKKLIWAITMPIVESLFTPQVMLLYVINMSLMGAVRIEDFADNDLGKILNLIINKIMGMLKAIVKYIKDMIIELLVKLLMSKLMPLLAKYMGALAKEKLEYWLTILTAALKCLPTIPMFNLGNKTKSQIDNVNYADIIYTGTTTTPETSSPC